LNSDSRLNDATISSKRKSAAIVDSKSQERKSLADKSRRSFIGMGSNHALSPKNESNLLSPKNKPISQSRVFSPKTPGI